MIFAGVVGFLGVFLGPSRALLAPIGPYWRPMVPPAGRRGRVEHRGSAAGMLIRIPKPYKFAGFCDCHGPKPYEFIGFGAMDVTKPYEFIGFGAMDVTKPYKFAGFCDWGVGACGGRHAPHGPKRGVEGRDPQNSQGGARTVLPMT
jgi:hypothetical protein